MKRPAGTAIVRTIIALVIGGVSLWLLVVEALLGKDAHTEHLFLFAGGVLLSLAIGWPQLFFTTAKQIVVLIPEVRIGGKRWSDPPTAATPPAAPTTKDEGVP